MTKEHQIILSMYYANPDNDPGKIPDITYTKSMDLEQLLLMLKVVFKINECQFYTSSQGIVLCPIPEKEAVYKKLADPNVAPYMIINANNKKNVKFKTTDYQNVRKIKCEDGTSNHLFYLNILIDSINSRCTVSTRHTFAHYILLNTTHDLTFFILLIKYLITSYSCGGEQAVENITCALAIEADMLKTIFDNRAHILTDMKKRCLLSESSYDSFFDNEDLTARAWIEEKLADESTASIIEFTYKNNNRICQIAKRLVCHVIKICQILSNGKSCLKLPAILSDEFHANQTKRSPDLNKLDGLLTELEELVQKNSVDFSPWLEKYMSTINIIYGC